MGYQLWTSPITGYRRRGTRLSDLRTLVDSGITIHAVLEPLQSCPAHANAIEMAHLMEQRDFDVAGVQDQENTSVIGFVQRERLVGGLVRDHAEPLTPDHLISDSTPLRSALSVLRAKRRVFVLIGASVRGIATQADLNKPPVRIYLFSLVSLLEMHLSFWIRAQYPGDAWQQEISTKRLEAAVKVNDERKAAGQNSELVDCIQISDKRDLLLKRKDLCFELGFDSKNGAERILKKGEGLRNLLAHGQQNLVDGSSWEELIGLTEALEEFVRKSDDLVEQQAIASAKQGLPTLWLSA